MNLEKVLVSTGLLLLPTLWLQSVLHQAPRFAGSLGGGAVGIAATLLMMVPLAYVVAKRASSSPAFLSRASALRWHVWSTTAGALLAIVHSGHAVQSLLGLLLVAAMLLSLLSGYVGRHYHAQVAVDLREQQAAAERLRRELDEAAVKAAEFGDDRAWREATARIAEALAETEYSIRADAWLRGRLRGWLQVHVVTSVLFYALLAAHIWTAFQYGVRWLAAP